MVAVGDIFVATWGYDQTNADFFEVVGVTGASVKVRHIRGKETPDKDGFMTGSVVPIKGSFDGEVKTRRLRFSSILGGEVFDAGDSMGSAELWDGQPVRVSHYA